MQHSPSPHASPRLNEPAPDFEAETTRGPRSLRDYIGRWLVLFSHPADFTPVCTSEFVAFARASGDFAALGCDLLGLSVDSLHSHVAWLHDIEESFGVEIPFPVIADTSMQIASAYGMVHPGASDTSAVRSVFVIDPDGMLRATLAYPMPTGRSVSEILRLVQALRHSAETRVLTPEGWQPGEPGLLPPSSRVEAGTPAATGSSDAPTWYFRRAPAPGDSGPPGA